MKNFTKTVLSVFLVCFAFQATQAAENKGPILNKVILNLQVAGWVKTKTARVTIGVDATLGKSGLADIQQKVSSNLRTLNATGQWHITQFSRRKTQSGLEQVHVEAQARLQQSELTSLRGQAKKLSRPGMTYRVVNIAYTPSLVERNRLQQKLREEIYGKAREELIALNKIYSDESFSLHEINFVPMPIMPSATTRLMAAKVTANNTLPSSQEMILSARVVLASKIYNR